MRAHTHARAHNITSGPNPTPLFSQSFSLRCAPDYILAVLNVHHDTLTPTLHTHTDVRTHTPIVIPDPSGSLLLIYMHTHKGHSPSQRYHDSPGEAAWPSSPISLDQHQGGGFPSPGLGGPTGRPEFASRREKKRSCPKGTS